MPAGTALVAAKTRHPYLRIVDFKEGSIDKSNLQYVPDEAYPSIARYIIDSNDLYISIVGTIGLVGKVPLELSGANLTENAAKICQIDSTVINRDYLGYFLRSEIGQAAISSMTVGSTQPKLALFRIEQIEVPCPSLDIQESIVSVLNALDDRITLLRETNTTLEAIAQALFKSWFVDFDPVHAKMQGRAPKGMDEATAALFPDNFEESELGPVPKGWSVGSVGDFARLKKGSVNPGSQPDTVFEHFSLPAFDDGQNPVIESGASIKSNKTPIPEDAVLLSKLNPHIPRIWLPVNAGRNAVCSTEFLAFQPTGVGSRELIYCQFSSPEFISRLQQLVTGTSNSHQRIKPDQVALMTSVVPTASAASAFEILIRPIFERVHANRQKVQTLSAIRNVLLPRLISGQLRISDALTEMDGV